MKSVFKYIIVLFFMGIYSYAAFNVVDFYENENDEYVTAKGTQLSVLSKIICPQVIGNGGQVDTFLEENNFHFEPSGFACLPAQSLSYQFEQSIDNYRKKALQISLNLPLRDLIYPYYFFW